MSHTSFHRAPDRGRASACIAAVGDQFRRYRTYRATLKEMRGLSGRELDDLGLSPSIIRARAYKAAYED